MTKVEDLILSELKHLRANQEAMQADVAVLKAKHDNGNTSERVAACAAILALIISVVVGLTSCKRQKHEKEIRTRAMPTNLKSYIKRAEARKSK